MKKPTPAELAAFRKLDQAAQRKALLGQTLEREFTIERESSTVDQEARTVWMSIASEESYERWWGVEILSVDRNAIKAERLKRGAPLLVGHDPDRQVGVVEAYEITPSKRLRIKARFGRSAYAEEIWQDVLDGIRRNTSVGYVIHDLELVKQEGDTSFYRVTSWEPLEGSIVAVPADATVGVGRSCESAPAAPDPSNKKARAMDEKEQERLRQDAADRAAKEAREKEQKRAADLIAAGEQYKEFGGPEVALELVKSGGTVEQFREKMLAKIATRTPPTTTAAPAMHPAPYGDGARHIIMRGGQLRAFVKPVRFSDGAEMDPLEAAYRAGQWLRAVVGRIDSAAKWCRERGVDVQERVMTESVGASGGYLVPVEMEQAIIDLREQYGLARRLARRRPMASDTKSVPKRTGGVTAYFIEEDNSGITAADKSWGNVNFVAKTLAALTLISESLEEDSIIDVVDDLAREQAYAFATKEDQCWLIGDGTSTYGGMQGLITLFEATAYASRFTAAAAHDTFAEIDNADLSGVMGAVADFPGLNPSWVASKTFAENVFGRLKRVAGGNAGADLDRRYNYGYGGYPGDTSEVMPKGAATDYTNKVIALFGDFSMASSFADRRGIMVKVLRERYAEKLQVGIRSHERFQIVNHDLGDTTNKGPVAALYGGT